jgi:hypothetical protein
MIRWPASCCGVRECGGTKCATVECRGDKRAAGAALANWTDVAMSSSVAVTMVTRRRTLVMNYGVTPCRRYRPGKKISNSSHY